MSLPRSWLGISFVLLVSAAFALVSVLGRLALDSGSTVFTVNLFRTVGAALTVLAFLGLRGRLPALPARAVRSALGLGVAVAGYSYCLFVAISVMPVALAVVTFYTWPLMVGIGAWATGAERLTWQWPIAALSALAGLVLALDIVGATPDFHGTLLALVAALGWSTVLMLNRLVVGGGDSLPVTFHMMLAASAVNLIGSLATGGITMPHGTAGWVGLIGTVTLYCFASVGTFIAAAIGGPVRTALIMNFEPIVSLIAGVILLDQVLSPLQIFGAVLVVGSLLVARRASVPVGRP